MLELFRLLWQLITECARRQLDEEIDREIRKYQEEHIPLLVQIIPSIPEPIRISINPGGLLRRQMGQSDLMALEAPRMRHRH